MPMVDSGTGLIAGGQEMTVDMTLGSPVSGNILNGRVSAVTDTLPLTFKVDEFTIPLMVTNAQVRFNVLSDGASVSEGVIGGSVLVSEVVDAAENIMPGIGTLAQGLLNERADIEPSSADPAICDRISMGLTFAGVSATVPAS